MSFFTAQTRKIEIEGPGGTNTVTVRKLTYGEQQAVISASTSVDMTGGTDANIKIDPAKLTEKIATEARAERDRLLADSDKHTLADRWAAMSAAQQTAWATYRQALRDVPEQPGFPQSIQWPIKPEQA
jgi:hypothetical protein